MQGVSEIHETWGIVEVESLQQRKP